MAGVTRRDTLRLATAAALGGAGTAASANAAASARQGPAKVYDLAFRGGAVKGVAFVGALEVLLKQASKPKIGRMIGTSAGAIFATCLAAGYTPAAMLKELAPRKNPGDPNDGKLPFALLTSDPLPGEEKVEPLPNTGLGKTLLGAQIVADMVAQDYGAVVATLLKYVPMQDILGAMLPKLPNAPMADKAQSASVVRKIMSLVQFGAACDDAPFRKWMEKLLANKAIHRDLAPTLTLKEFHKKISEPNHQQLSLVATDITTHETLVLNHLTAPDLPIIEAVRMSMSIPFVWPEVKWNADWGKYRGTPRITEAGEKHRIVDGGVLSNFPLRFLLDESHSKPDGVLGPPLRAEGIKEADVRSVGLFLNDAIPVDVPESKPTWYEQLPAYRTATAVLDTMMDSQDEEALRHHPNAQKAVCPIGTKGYRTLEFDMTEERMNALVERGRQAMTAYLMQPN
jgi:NTE family protein